LNGLRCRVLEVAARQPRKARSPAKPVSIAFLGAGNVLGAYIQALDRLIPSGAATLAGIYARNPKRRAELSVQRPGVRLLDGTDEALGGDVDAVVIITPPDSHAELARAALLRGKHVLVEKPLALDGREARALAALARRRGLHLVAAPFVHLSPTFRLLHTLVANGGIGPVHSARGLYGNAGSHWAAWYFGKEGGPLADLGIYNIKSLTTLLGPVVSVYQEAANSARLRAVAGRKIRKPEPDVAHTLMTHRNGAISSIVASHAIPAYERPGLELYGSTGTAYLRGDDWDPRGVDIWRESTGTWESFAPIEPTWLWTDGLIDLVGSIRAGRAPQSDLAQDLHLIDVLDAAEKSRRRRAPVAVRATWEAPAHPGVRVGSLRRLLRPVHDHTRPSDEQ
jgi:predicted dehydrogenase